LCFPEHAARTCTDGEHRRVAGLGVIFDLDLTEVVSPPAGLRAEGEQQSVVARAILFGSASVGRKADDHDAAAVVGMA
jgi:hypothetical protein